MRTNGKQKERISPEPTFGGTGGALGAEGESAERPLQKASSSGAALQPDLGNESGRVSSQAPMGSTGGGKADDSHS